MDVYNNLDKPTASFITSPTSSKQSKETFVNLAFVNLPTEEASKHTSIVAIDEKSDAAMGGGSDKASEQNNINMNRMRSTPYMEGLNEYYNMNVEEAK